MSIVLYRKYRPQSFAEVVGQEHVVRTLTNAISSGMISHAYLFSGPRGSGKTTLARLLAKSANCLNRKDGQFEPCNKCSSCLEIAEGRALDLIEIDAASHRGIDDIRELRDGIRFSPTKTKYKIFIVDECHQLSKDASNALLKTLEEPPSHAIFVLATTEIHKMISTIISRCQKFDFRKLTAKEIIEKLESICKKEKVKVEKPALELIALNSAGSIRDAESILDQVLTSWAGSDKKIETEEVKDLLGLVELNLVSQFADLISEKKGAEAINFLNELIERGVDVQEFAKTLINYLRQALILKISAPSGKTANPIITGLTKEEFQKLQGLTENFTEQDISRILNLFFDAENKMRYSPIPQLPLELAIIEAINQES